VVVVVGVVEAFVFLVEVIIPEPPDRSIMESLNFSMFLHVFKNEDKVCCCFCCCFCCCCCCVNIGRYSRADLSRGFAIRVRIIVEQDRIGKGPGVPFLVDLE
jgi:hypothetical protein